MYVGVATIINNYYVVFVYVQPLSSGSFRVAASHLEYSYCLIDTMNTTFSPLINATTVVSCPWNANFTWNAHNVTADALHNLTFVCPFLVNHTYSGLYATAQQTVIAYIII